MALWGRVIICGKADKAIINEGNMRDKVTYMEESEFVALANTDRMSVFLICIKNKQGELSGNIINFYLKAYWTWY